VWHAPLGVRSAKRRHQSPEWTILSHSYRLIQWEVVWSQVLLDSLHPRGSRTSWWSPPVLWRGSSYDTCTCSQKRKNIERKTKTNASDDLVWYRFKIREGSPGSTLKRKMFKQTPKNNKKCRGPHHHITVSVVSSMSLDQQHRCMYNVQSIYSAIQ